MALQSCLRVVRLTETAQLPTKAHPSDAGYDLYADADYRLSSPDLFLNSAAISTGIAVAIPEGYVGIVKGRSGFSFKQDVDVLAGVIDCHYRGEIKVKLVNHGNADVHITRGNRIAQMLIVPILSPEVIEVSELDSTDRGEKGFGSSGM